MTEQDTYIKLFKIDEDLIPDQTLKNLIKVYQQALLGLKSNI